ncbi:uncharacterized protein LOC142980062 [Anticarsia gemmatalis]|uniref:uncharacterized protein LOC142980062 n=1 Tax=Anticarsia gemmatalis TaxID=129554 RepID=UPI003F75F284
MNTARLQLTRYLLNYVRLINNIQRLKTSMPHQGFYSTFTMDAFTSELIERHKNKFHRHDVLLSELSVQHCTTTESKYNVTELTNVQMDNMFTDLLSKNKDKQVQDLILECQNYRKFITNESLKKLFRHYGNGGKPEMVVMLQTFIATIDPISYKRNGEFLHHLARAQCMKGNSEKGLSLLKSIYIKYTGYRSFYRLIFRDLIQDSVLNRSEASLMVFKKYVIEFSEELSEHYPLVCFWHICWASSWFSDQMLSNDLLEMSEVLQEIVRDKATAFSIMALKDFNEDAVVRLLQTLLKYDMMIEYAAVLQVLFNYKLKNRDIRGCTEIIRNCEVLGIVLPSNQQGRYITMLIEDKKRRPEEPSRKPSLKDFKLKF